MCQLESKRLGAIRQKKISLILNNPIYVGFTILEISKWKMYNFQYNFLIKKFNTKLLFIDIDTLRFEIDGKKIYRKIYKHKELSDLRNFSLKSKYYCYNNKKQLLK